MKRLLVLSYDYPPNDGGISRLCAAVVSELAEWGWPVEVLTVSHPDCSVQSRPAIPAIEVSKRRIWRELVTAWLLLTKGRNKTLVATVWNPEATLATVFSGNDLWIMAHGNEVMSYPPGILYRGKNWIRRRVLAHAKGVICNSHYTERLVKALQPSAKTSVINPGVDLGRFNISVAPLTCRENFGLPKDKRILLSVSRMDAHKGHDVVLKALAKLPLSERTRIQYVVAGKGHHVPALKALAQSLSIADSVTWLGFVADTDLPCLYRAADLFVLCTREDPNALGVEGFGMVFLEAQAAGVPVIGTRAGGIPDAIKEGEGGWLIDQDDVEAMTRHLHSLVTDITPFLAQGALARSRAQRLGAWSSYVKKMTALIENE